MTQKTPFRKSRTSAFYKGILLFAISMLAYVNTIQNDYALDDVFAITRNQFTQKGFAGIEDILTKNFFAGFLGEKEVALAGGRYRPLSLVTFAVEIEIFGNNPHASHMINIILYALLVVLLYRVFRQAFTSEKTKLWLSDPFFLAALLFALHPIHTEVVANIKGRDEILAFGFSLLSLQAALSLKKPYSPKLTLWMLIAFFLALMSKENAAAFLFIIPLCLYWTGKHGWDPVSRSFFLLLIPLGIFILIRMAVLGTLNPGVSTELMDNPFLGASLSERLGTILLTFGEYYRLMVFPHPLTWDYYPYHIPLVSLSSMRAIVPLLITVALLGLALWGSRAKKIYAFGLWFFFLSFFMVSNLLLTTGVFMAERFLFIPSYGLILAISLGAVWLSQWKKGRMRQLVNTLLVIIMILFTVKTFSRNRVWKDNFTLYTTDVEVSKNSAKGNNIAGQFYAYEANQVKDVSLKALYREKAIKHLKHAVEIHPRYSDAWFNLGNTWYDTYGSIDSLLFFYGKVLEQNAKESSVWDNLNRLAKAGLSVEDRIKLRAMMLKMYPGHAESLLELGRLRTSQNAFEEALPYVREAVRLLPQDAVAWETLGYIYYSQAQLDSAIVAYTKAYELDSGNPNYRQNLYAILFRQGRLKEAAAYAPR